MAAEAPSHWLKESPHWHGTSPGDYMEHLAMLENTDDPASTHKLA
ncbi:hypothetical protein [Arthrobacter sp. ATA002]|nr:hypothetical protein [Arthrobacter sp. ATA002]